MISAGTQRKPMNQSDDGIKGEFWMISAKLKRDNPPAIQNLLLNSPDETGILQSSHAKGINMNMKKTAAKTATKIRFFLETSRPENSRGNGTRASVTGLMTTLMASRNALSSVLPLV